MLRKVSFLFLALSLILGGTSVQNSLFAQSSKSPLELQALQARDFETTKETAFAAVVTVLQDAGYIISSADLNSGFITASSPIGSAKGKKKAKRTITFTKVTAFLIRLNDETTRIRLNFVSIYEKIDYDGSRRKDTPIEEPLIYQNSFEEISKTIFMLQSFQ